MSEWWKHLILYLKNLFSFHITRTEETASRTHFKPIQNHDSP
jgi:hypothetical protein